MVANSHTTFTFDVVNSDIPLLLGKETMKKWDLIIYTAKEIAELTIDGKKGVVELFTARSNHWCIPIQPCNVSLEAVTTLFTVSGMSSNEKKKAAKIIHRQFCHLSYDFMEKVLKDVGANEKEFLSELKKYSNECETCQRYKRTMPRPAVGNLFDPEKMNFNELFSHTKNLASLIANANETLELLINRAEISNDPLVNLVIATTVFTSTDISTGLGDGVAYRIERLITNINTLSFYTHAQTLISTNKHRENTSSVPCQFL